MNKQVLVETVAKDANISAAGALAALNAITGAITGALAEGDSVALPGFGTFEVRQRSQREGRNPQTGEAMTIPASKVAAFKPASALKKAVNGD
jgi:DNA-binding protein HU-beta